MLVEFSVGNYRSFFEPVTLSLQAAKLRSIDKTVDANNVFEFGGLELLRSAAVYGANASGKSNLVQAMQFMGQLVLQSSKESQADEPIDVEPFRLNTSALEKPSFFQIIFYLQDCRYRYGFEVDNRRICSEWLYRTRKAEAKVFVREGDQYDISGTFKEGQGLEERTRDNALFLSVVAQFNGKLATSLLGWFRRQINIISGLNDIGYAAYTRRRFESDDHFRARVLAFVRQADLGISDIHIDTVPLDEAKVSENVRLWMEQTANLLKAHSEDRERRDTSNFKIKQVKTRHQVFDQQHQSVGWDTLDLEKNESQGTQKIFSLSGPLIDTLEKGKVLVIDELEARLHPSITQTVISLFNSPQTNPKNAQLVFVTHDT
ncbi:MAG: ATP-binding protein, partial [Anaerolineae bacterium]|nr:ATP-binding protein [Anaerolineae bacterium]